MSVFGWIVVHQHINSNGFDWQRSWADYRAGFGSVDADFWLGLEKVHLLTTSQPCRLRVEMQQESTGDWYSAEYSSFSVGDETNDKYRIAVDGYSGDAGDGLQYPSDGATHSYHHDGMSFTTYDQDNDPAGYNCAGTKGGGWWYNACTWACTMCNPDYHEWHSMSPPILSVSRMMIRLQ